MWSIYLEAINTKDGPVRRVTRLASGLIFALGLSALLVWPFPNAVSVWVGVFFILTMTLVGGTFGAIVVGSAFNWTLTKLEIVDYEPTIKTTLLEALFALVVGPVIAALMVLLVIGLGGGG